MEAEHSVLRLVPPVDIAQWGKGGYVKDSDPSSLQSALFPGVDFQAGGFAEVIELDSAVIRAVAKSQFRRALNSEDSSDPLSNGLRHLATLNRLRASEPSHTLTRTTFGSAVVDVELSTAFARIRSDSELAALGVFPYAYRIRVTNRGSETCQLVGRHWKFEDAAQHVIEVPRSSPGVVGHSPVLEPGQARSFCYCIAEDAEDGCSDMICRVSSFPLNKLRITISTVIATIDIAFIDGALTSSPGFRVHKWHSDSNAVGNNGGLVSNGYWVRTSQLSHT